MEQYSGGCNDNAVCTYYPKLQFTSLYKKYESLSYFVYPDQTKGIIKMRCLCSLRFDGNQLDVLQFNALHLDLLPFHDSKLTLLQPSLLSL